MMDVNIASVLAGEAQAAEINPAPVNHTPAPDPTWASDIHDLIGMFHDSPPMLQMSFLICMTIIVLVLISKANRKIWEDIPLIGKYFKPDELPAPAPVASAPEQPKISSEALHSFEAMFHEMYQQTNSLLTSLANGIEHLGADLDRVGERIERTATVMNQCVVDITDLSVEIRRVRLQLGRDLNVRE